LMGGYLEEGLQTAQRVMQAVGLRLPRTALRTLVRVVWSDLRLRARRLRWTPTAERDVDEATLAAMDTTWSIGAGLGMVDALRGVLYVTLGPLLCIPTGEEFRIARAAGA